MPVTPMVAKISAMEVRIDKWLWAARIFKTRSLATLACRKGKVQLNGQDVRSSKSVKVDDLITVSMPGINRKYRVLALIEKRVGAKLAGNAVREETPTEDLDRYELIRRDPLAVFPAFRPRGSGRPSKKERRELEQFTDLEPMPESEDEAEDEDDESESEEE